MKVHFVCTGNTYRSRLAQAYLNSKKIKNITVFSSGIEAGKNLSGPITWYSARILFYKDMVNFMSETWQQTTKELLDKGDITVFLDNTHYDFCKNNFGFEDPNYEIWDIDDMDLEMFKSYERDIEKVKFTEDGFNKIKDKVDLLIENKLS